jgi:predicted Rossmann fold nucleotide-binding protein DprA/Smf involved in DNA uptake
MSPGEPYRLDELIGMTGLEGAKLLPRLMELELQGRVISGPGGAFSRITK